MTSKGTQIFVTKLSRDTTRDDLRDLFRKYGKIREISIKRSYAFVDFYDYHDANDAIESTDGTRWQGNKLVVEKAGEKKQRRSGPKGPQASGNFNPPLTLYRQMLQLWRKRPLGQRMQSWRQTPPSPFIFLLQT